ncbi:MAG: hypothetical protein ACKVQT_08175 [Burkholderiales bacterium]
MNAPEAAATPEKITITLVLKHHPGLVLDEIQSLLKASDWWESFPPAGVRIVSWTVAMGLGRIATLEMAPHLLPVVNLELERRGWGVFSTECYATYDFMPVRARIRERVRSGGQ